MLRQLVITKSKYLLSRPPAEKLIVSLLPFICGGDFPEIANTGEWSIGEFLTAVEIVLAESDFEEYFYSINETYGPSLWYVSNRRWEKKAVWKREKSKYLRVAS